MSSNPISGPEPDPLDRLVRRLKDKQAADLAYRCALHEAVTATGSVRQVEAIAGLSRPSIHKLIKHHEETWVEQGIRMYGDDRRWHSMAPWELDQPTPAGLTLEEFAEWLSYWEAEDAEAALEEWIGTLPMVDQDKAYRAIHRHFEDASYEEDAALDQMERCYQDSNRQVHYPHTVVGWEAVVEAGLPAQMTIPWHPPGHWAVRRNWTDLRRDLGMDDGPDTPAPPIYPASK